MTSNFNLNMWPILEWMNGHMDRNFSMRFIDPVPVPVVVLMLQDKHWQCERRVTFTHLSNSAVSDLNRAVEAMLQDWAARVDSGELRSLISGGTLRDAVQTDDTTQHLREHGHGRCPHCGSRDLWDDNLAFGCRHCKRILGGN